MNRLAPVLAPLCLALALACAACISSSAERGVSPRWHAAAVAFEEGATTRADVLAALGPPSQILTSDRGSAFYYLLERTKTKGLILLVYNTRKELTDYDRAVFFFDEAGLLREWSLSEPLEG